MNKTFCRARVLQISPCSPNAAAQLITDFLARDLDVRQDVDRNLAKVADSLKAWKALPEALQVTTAQQAVSAPQATPAPRSGGPPQDAGQKAQTTQPGTTGQIPTALPTTPVAEDGAAGESRAAKKKKKRRQEQLTGGQSQAVGFAVGQTEAAADVKPAKKRKKEKAAKHDKD